MDTFRKALWFSLAGVLVGLWNAWRQDYPPIVTQVPTPVVQTAVTSNKNSPISITPTAPPIPIERQITFQTDVIKGVIDKEGGHLVSLSLLQYAASADTNKKSRHPLVLLDHSVDRYYIAQTDLLRPNESAGHEKKRAYQSEKTHYTLSSDQDTLCIHLHSQEDGIAITKQFILKKGRYQVDINYKVHNGGQAVWQARPYAQLTQQVVNKANGFFSMAPYRGCVISSDSKPYEKVAFDSLGKKDLPQATQHGWLSFVEPYFASAWISKLPAISYYSHKHNNVYTLGMLGDVWDIPAGQSIEGNIALYVGPKAIEPLQNSAKHLGLLVDYGMLWPLATALFWLLTQCHHGIGNWGWAIVCVSALVKLSLYRFSAKQFRAMQAMRKLHPQLTALNKRYANDAQKRMQAEWELKRQAGVGPMGGGALAALIPLPISIALYRVLLESIELRHEPFLFWIKDLSATDPYYILPVLIGFALFIDQKMGSASGEDVIQANTSLFIMSILFTLISINFSTGLGLYWLTQNICSILQKWWLLYSSYTAEHSVKV
jgi:YidC/Oxa1 family membrane protein insertase